MEPAILSALRQLRLIIVGATIGAIAGSVVLRTSDDLRPVSVVLAAGAVLLGMTFAMQWFASQHVPRLAPAYSSLIGRVIVTLAAALSVVLVFNLLVAPGPRVPTRPNAQATVRPLSAAPSQSAGPTTPVRTAVPVMPASPQQVARPPAPISTTSFAPPATMQAASSPAATPPVSPIATSPASPQSPPPSLATAAPVQSVAPATPQPATPQPTQVASPPSIVPTLPPLPTLPIRLP